MRASLSVVAKRLDFVHETQGQNRGAWVEFLQRFCKGQPGDSWCAYFVTFVLDVACFGKSPLIRSGSCSVLLNDARRLRYIVAVPQVDDLFFFITPEGHAHHVGIVTAVVEPFIDVSGAEPVQVPRRVFGIAGNTSSDGRSSNGDGVHDHELLIASNLIVFVRLP